MPFEVLIDTDVGLWNLISSEYKNEIFFLPGMLKLSDSHRKYFMVVRENRNPLMTLVSEPSQELADDFYSQFMEKEYDNILSLSPNTDVCKVLDLMRKSNSSIIRLTILCENEKQKELILRRNLMHDNIIVSDKSSISLSEYGTMFVKDVSDLDKYRIVEGKTIYVANYGFNILMDPENVNPLLPVEVLEKYAGQNEFFVYSVYNFNAREIPKG